MKTQIRLTVAIGIWLVLVVPVAADHVCNQPGNLTQNCNFDRFVDRSSGGVTRIVPEGWTPWAIMGSPAFDIDNHGSFPGAPAQRIWSDGGTWTAGLYQQVSVTPGKWYEARIEWAPVSRNLDDMERRVGIDPNGGVDPGSPRIVWGPSTYVVKAMDLRVGAFAQSPTITVFVWTHHPVSHGTDEVFLDAVGLVQDPSRTAPTATARPPTPMPTRRPPTRTPRPQSPAAPTALPPSPTPTETPSPTPTLIPTDTSTPAPSPTWTITPSPAPPTATPWPTRTPLPTIEGIARAVGALDIEPVGGAESPGQQSMPPALLLAFVALAMVAALAGLVIWLGKRSRQGLEKQTHPKDASQEVEE